MAEVDFSNNEGKSEIAKIADQIHVIASKLAGFSPLLKMLTDSSSVNCHVGNSLETIGGMSDYINDDLCGIADRLGDLDKATRRVVS